MKTLPSRLAFLVAVAALALVQPASAGIIHRYSFDETSGTTVNDSVGTADGIVKGNNAYFDGAGALVLPGQTRSDADAATIAGYVDLPNHMFNVLTNLTVETWVSWWGYGSWQRIFDFGTSAGGEDISDGNGNYLFLSPAGDVNLRFAVREPVNGTEPVQLTAPAPLPTSDWNYYCVTVTYDYSGNVSRLYSNGVMVASGGAMVPLSSINDVNNWLGRSQWGPDLMFQGNLDEVRIYDNALNPLEVAASYVSGSTQPSTNPGNLGPVQAVNLTVPQLTLTEGDTTTASGSADFMNLAGVVLKDVPGVTFSSDTPAVLTVDTAGLVTAVAPGTAILTLSYQGVTDSETITVNARQIGIVVAGSLFVDLRASDVASDASVWPNRAGTGNFIAAGTPTYVADVNGTGVAGVQFNPVTPATDAYEGPLTTADLHGSSDCSIEVWAYNPAIADEETLVAWGRRGGPDGSNMSFNYGAHATWGAVGHWGSPDMGWSGPAPVAGQWHYLVYTFDGLNTDKVYADGVVRTTETATLNVHPDLPIRLGAQSNTGGTAPDFGQALSGYIAMVRVHTGLLSANDVANNFLFGPTLTPPGALQSVSLTPDRTTLVGVQDFGRLQVVAHFENVPNINVTSFSTLESSDTNVLTVTPAGLYQAVKVGTATITGTYRGTVGTQVITVAAVPVRPLELKHRYSFSEAVGATTVDDSVGTADGVIKGNGAAFDGAGHLSLPGGGASSADPAVIAGYVDLPNYILSPLVNVSIEAWVTWQTNGSAWQRIFDFGTSAGGEDISNGNGSYLFMSPQGDANLRFAARDPRTGGEPTQLTASAPLPQGEEVYVAVSYDYAGNRAALYRNAVEVATGPAMVPLALINDVNNWLGRAQWPDAMFQGTYNEFRIWEGALTAEQVAASYAAGPDQLPTMEGPTMTASLEGGSLVIRWPATAVGFAMESTTALAVSGPSTWVPVDISGAVDEGGQKKLTLQATGSAQFYRMKK